MKRTARTKRRDGAPPRVTLRKVRGASGELWEYVIGNVTYPERLLDPAPVLTFDDFTRRIVDNAENAVAMLRRLLPRCSGMLIIGSQLGLHGLAIASHLTTHERRSVLIDELFPDIAYRRDAQWLAFVAVAFMQATGGSAEQGHVRAIMREQIARGDLTGAVAMLTVVSESAARTFVLPLEGNGSPEERRARGAYEDALQNAISINIGSRLASDILERQWSAE